jgi:nucleotide-binding universal stress UspA family protein
MINRIVTGVDGSKPSQDALEWSCELARTYHAQLILLHALLFGVSIERLHLLAKEGNFLDEIGKDLREVELAPTARPDMVGVPPLVTVPGSLLKKIGQYLLLQAEARAKTYGITHITTRLSEEDPAQAILKCGTQTSADLIIMGSRGLSGLQSLVLGSVSRKVLQESSCACLIVKEKQ